MSGCGERAAKGVVSVCGDGVSGGVEVACYVAVVVVAGNVQLKS